jgi:hypothetical protein
MKKPAKLYVIKKFVMANSAAQAMRLERTTPVDSVWIDEEWSKGNARELAAALGYMVPTESDL